MACCFDKHGFDKITTNTCYVELCDFNKPLASFHMGGKDLQRIHQKKEMHESRSASEQPLISRLSSQRHGHAVTMEISCDGTGLVYT